MKNFFKKLSFVMAAAMVVTSLYTPAKAEAATKNFVRVKGSNSAVTSKNIYVGGRIFLADVPECVNRQPQFKRI